MKVLWFSNTPASGDEYLKANVIRGGWLKSLDKILKTKVELHVAFYYPKYVEPFEYKGVYYYPICKRNWKFQFVKKQIFGDYVDKEDLGMYLEIIKQVNPDIIHIHGSENSFGCLFEVTKIPIVLSIQGNRTVYHHKYFSGIEKKYLNIKQFTFSTFKFGKVFTSHKTDYANSKKTQLREIKNIKNCKNFIGRTSWDKRVTRVLAPTSIYFHNDEVLRDSFYNTIWSKTQNNRLIIQSTIGTNFFKGLETLCESLSKLIHLGQNVEWRVAGINENDLIVKVVRKKLGKRFPSKGLVLQGNLREDQLIASLLKSDIYVMPSHIENSPNNLCEAMIIGMPCISTFVGGTGSLLKDGEDGLLIQDGDPWAMAGAIMELNQDQESAIMYGQNARIRALIRHDKEKIVNDLVTIYNTVIQNASNSQK